VYRKRQNPETAQAQVKVRSALFRTAFQKSKATAKKSVLNNSRTTNRKQTEQQGKSCDERKLVYLLFFLSALGACFGLRTLAVTCHRAV
jgi:hypothetical protein